MNRFLTSHRMTISCSLAAVMLLTIIPVNSANAQQNNRRQFVEGLLRVLVESQMNRDEEPPRPPTNRPPVQQVPANLVKARTVLAGFSTEAGKLAHQLHNDARSNPALRYHLTDALRINASARVLASRAASSRSTDLLTDDITRLDQDWRKLSHRLHEVDRLSAPCKSCLAKIDTYDKQLCELFELGPQVDYAALRTHAESLRGGLAHLREDIEIEFARTTSRVPLERETQQLEQRAIAICAAASKQAPYAVLKNEFMALNDNWSHLSQHLRKTNNRYIERDVRRIDQILRPMHELLWLQQPIDYALLNHLNNTLTNDVNALFDSVSLNMLLQLRNSDGVLDAASEFHGLCEHFTDEVKTRAPLSILQEDFGYMNESWPKLAGCFRGTKHPKAIQALNAIEASFVTLRSTLRLRPAVDWHEIAECGAALEDLSGRFAATLQHCVHSNTRYDNKFRTMTVNRMNEFRAVAAHIHELAHAHKDYDHLREDCHELIEIWGSICTQCVGKLHPSDQIRLRAMSQQIAPLVVKLEAIVQ